MTNPARRAYLAARLAHKKLVGISITVSRGLNTSAPLVATVGSSGSLSYESDGSQAFVKNRDYLIEVAAYVVNGTAVEPARFDIITEVINGAARTFEVLDANGDGSSTSTDAGITVYRVHTKEV
jgi:hypothetical protein